MRPKATFRAVLVVLVALSALASKRAFAEQPVCVDVTAPYLSDGAPLAASGATGAIGPGASRLRAKAIAGIVVGSKVLVGAGVGAKSEIVSVAEVTPDAAASGYAFYSVTLARAHAWDEAVYRAWVGHLCAPRCEDAAGAFPACIPRCPAWTPCRGPGPSNPATNAPLAPFAPSTTPYGYTPPPGHSPPPLPTTPTPPPSTPPPPNPYTPGPVYPPGASNPYPPSTSPTYGPGAPPTPPPPALPPPGH